MAAVILTSRYFLSALVSSIHFYPSAQLGTILPFILHLAHPWHSTKAHKHLPPQRHPVSAFFLYFGDTIQLSALSLDCCSTVLSDQSGCTFCRKSLQRRPSHQNLRSKVFAWICSSLLLSIVHHSMASCVTTNFRPSTSVVFYVSHPHSSTGRMVLLINSAFRSVGISLPQNMSQSFMKTIHLVLPLPVSSTPKPVVHSCRLQQTDVDVNKLDLLVFELYIKSKIVHISHPSLRFATLDLKADFLWVAIETISQILKCLRIFSK